MRGIYRGPNPTVSSRQIAILGTGHKLRGGGATKREEGGHVKFHPYEKGGAQTVLALQKGGGAQSVA